MSLAEPALWLIEAGAGYGKTVLLDQMRSHDQVPTLVTRRPVRSSTTADFTVELAGAARRAELEEVEAAIVAADGDGIAIARALAIVDCRLFIDDADAWDDEVGALLIELIGEISDRCFCVLTGRSLASFGELRQRPQSRRLAAKALAFSRDEVEQLVTDLGGDATVADLISSATQGWPLAAATLARRIEQTGGPLRLETLATEHANLIDGLIRACFDNLDGSDFEASIALARLPFFDEVIAESVGSAGLVSRLADAGVPLTRRSDGWLELAEQVRQSLVQQGRAAVPADRVVLDHYVVRGEINSAISVCLATGSYQQAAELIAGLNNDQLTRLEPSTLNAAIATLGEAVAHAPRCLLVQALVNGTFGRMSDGLRAIERAEEYFALTDPNLTQDAHLEALLELGTWRSFTGKNDAAWRHLDRVVDRLDGSSRVDLRARAHDLRGLLLQDGGSEETLERSAAEMTEALRLWRSIAEARPAAATVFRLAGGVLADLGQRTTALDILETLPSIGPMTLINRARLGLERSALLPFMGRADEVPAIVAEVRRLAGLLGHEWIVAWSYWTEIVAESVQGHGAQVEQLLKDYDAQSIRIGEDQTESIMWCDVAEAFARCQLHDRAGEMLARGRSLTGGFQWLLDYAEASIEARGGDADRALTLIEALDLVGEVEHERRWRIEFLRALACLRTGKPDEATKYLDRAFELAADLGQPQLPNHMEAGAVRQIRGGAMVHQETVTTGVAQLAGTQISLFGEFEVVVDGDRVDLPRGQVSDLVKLLVLGEGSLVVDQVIDRLWPDASIDVGRRRLRNLLGRLRETAPHLVERVDDSLRLGRQVSSDFAAGQEAARAALASDTTLEKIDDAIELNRHELLPTDRYEDWAEEAREEQRTVLIRLLDAKAAASEQAGNIDTTVSALTAAHELDPTGNRRRIAAELLRSAGRDVAASTLASDGP